MQYLCLIYSAPDSGPQTEAEFETQLGAYFAFNDLVGGAGKLLGGEP
ncbi:MAG: hypothetical protein ACI91O_001790, partial [Candidatus Poriferisodalaceae bacterium]